jgi:tyrosyl-tRNA synthetase
MTTPLTLDQQLALLMQGTEYGDENLAKSMEAELRAKLAEGRPLKVYCGYDPRTADLHLGHTITMRKLRQFQELGHEVTFLIGSYTSLVGDPSDKDKTRPVLTPAEVNRNSETYADQAARILDMSKARIRHNGEWLAELKLLDLIKLGQSFTLQQFLDRENFAKRWQKGEPIYLQETFYALMQGYDAVAQETDVQVGGTDQLFNIVTAGRKLQEAFGQKPQVGIIMGILPGTDGVVKMSKSLGNHIPLNTSPEDMYGKVMSVPDVAMPSYFRLATRWTPEKVAEVEAGQKAGAHPRDVKMALAWEITASFYGDAAANAAQEHFRTVFQKGGTPDDMPTLKLDGAPKLADFIAAHGLAKSKNEARRLIEQGGVKLDGQAVSDVNAAAQPGTLQVGKRTFVKVSST